MQSTLFKEVERHLEYQGYGVKYEDGVLKTDHATKPKFWVHPSLGGCLFVTIYALGAGAKEDRNALLTFLNAANGYSVVARFFCDDNSLSISAWFPRSYEKHAFSEFFDQYISDINAPPIRDPTAVRTLFWDEPNPQIPGLM